MSSDKCKNFRKTLDIAAKYAIFSKTIGEKETFSMSNGKNLQNIGSDAVSAPVSFAVFAHIISIAIIIISIS